MSENAIIIKRKSAAAIAQEAADKAKEYPELNTEVFTKVYTEAYEEGYVEVTLWVLQEDRLSC